MTGMKFCGACGARLANTCPSCAFENPPEFRFCGSCGHSLTAVPIAPPPPPPRPDRKTGERRQLTLLFCDLVDSTALAERVDAEEYRGIVRQYQAACASVIHRFDGHVAQYLGDGLLVYFGYPLAHEDDPRRAAHAALGMVEAVQALSIPGGVTLAVRIGVHTGTVVAGDISSAKTHERLAMGSAPNIAARLQGLAEPNTILLSGDTERLLHSWFEVESLGQRELKGVSRPVVVYRVLREARRNGRFELDDAKRLSPLVGRDEEDALLARRLTAAREGEGHVVLLSGEAGVGKSRLLQSMRARAIANGFTCLVGRSAAVHQNSALLPIVDLIEGLLGIDDETTAEARLERMEHQADALAIPREECVPLLAALLSVPLGNRYPVSGLLPQLARTRTFETLLTMLARGAQQRPIVFVIEDLHWADASTMEFLALFVNQPPIPRLVAVFTVRTEFALPWSARSPVTHLTLPRLGDRDVRRMIENLAGELQLPAALVQQVVLKTDGIPVFVEELTRMMLDLGLVDGGAPVTAASLASLIEIPGTLQDSLLARLDRLGDAKNVAQIGAVLGRVFPYDLLLAVSEFGEEELQGQLARLVDAELLYQRGSLPNATYTFKHALIQDAAYALLLRSSRRQLHERVATVLVSAFPTRAELQPELVAHHFTEAGLAREAIQKWQQAGMQSLQRSASVEAITQLGEGLKLLPEITNETERNSYELALLTTLGAAYAGMYGYAAPDTARTYARATELCDALGDAPELFWAIRGVWSAALVRGDIARALQLGERLLRAADVAGHDELRMEAHYTLGATHMFEGTLDAASEHFRRVLELDRPGRDTSGRLYTAIDVVASSMALAGQTAWMSGDLEAATRFSARALALADALAHPVSQAFTHNQAAMLAFANNNRDLVRVHAAETIRLSAQYGIFFAPFGAMMLSWANDDAATIQQMFGLVRAGGSNVGNTLFYFLQAEAELRMGDVGAAEASVEAGLALVAANGEGYWEPELHRLQGEIARTQDQADRARQAYERAVETAERRGFVPLAARAREGLTAMHTRTP
jgi:class 3 adenylate cyclase/predicted negative regulator of RcsB-dependent stress response